MSIFERMVERYNEGQLPWDSQTPPPEVITLAERLKPGRALDLGCGFGRTSIYLAKMGWQVDGIDFVPDAISEASERARKADVWERVDFHMGSVTELDFLNEAYDLAVDVGCMHILTATELQAYRDQLCRLLRPDGHYILFARLRDPNGTESDEPIGLPRASLVELFDDGFVMENVEFGETNLDDGTSWASAWFLFRRRPT
jgi:SAM-dependent methyltransferase